MRQPYWRKKKEKNRLHTAVTTLSGEPNFPIRKKKNQFKPFSTSENKTKKKRSNVPSPAHHLRRQTYRAMKISHSQAPQQQPNKQTKQNSLPRNLFPQKQKHKTLNSANPKTQTPQFSRRKTPSRGWAGIRNGATRRPPSGSHVGSNNTNNAPKFQYSFHFSILKMIP
jgi:hypothetical protein